MIIEKNKCFNCGIETKNSYPLCVDCQPRVLDPSSVCTKCGIPTSIFMKICPNCTQNKLEVKSNYSLFYYNGISKEILTQFKFKKDRSFSKLYANEIKKHLDKNFNDYIICPVPTSFFKRKLKNGYQLDSIIKELKKRNVDVRNLLIKKYNKNQKKLNKSDRYINTQTAYKLRSKTIPNKTIILFDDVFTTGATINSCSKLLNKNNNDIYSLTLYRD